MGHNPCIASWAAAGAVIGGVTGGGVGLVGVVGGGVAVVVTEPAGLALGAAGGGAVGAAVGSLVCPGTPPFPNQSDTWSKPPSTSQPYCKPMPRAIPFYRTPSIPWPGPPPDRDGCPEEISACYQLCAKAQFDPDMRNIWGGSMSTCMRGCVSARCQKGLRF